VGPGAAPLERLRAGLKLGHLISAHQSLKEGCTEDGSSFFFRGAQCQDQRHWEQAGKQEVPSEHGATHLCCLGDGALAQGPRGCRVSSWRCPEATWTWAWAPCLGCLCWSRGWTVWIWWSLPTSAILWFCEMRLYNRATTQAPTERFSPSRLATYVLAEHKLFLPKNCWEHKQALLSQLTWGQHASSPLACRTSHPVLHEACHRLAPCKVPPTVPRQAYFGEVP